MKNKFLSIIASRLLTPVCSFLLLTGSAQGAPDPTLLFNSFNTSGNGSGPTYLPVFTLTDTWTITSIVDYHYPYTSAYGEITIRDIATGNLRGPWPLSAWTEVSLSYWRAMPNIVLGPGSYEINDSARSTWAFSTEYTTGYWNDGANWAPYMGFSWVLGTPVPEPSTWVAGALAALMGAATCWPRRKAA